MPPAPIGASVSYGPFFAPACSIFRVYKGGRRADHVAVHPCLECSRLLVTDPTKVDRADPRPETSAFGRIDNSISSPIYALLAHSRKAFGKVTSALVSALIHGIGI